MRRVTGIRRAMLGSWPALTFVMACGWLVSAAGLSAAPPRVLPPGQLPNDVRLGPLKDLDGYFPFPVPDSLDAWHVRAEQVRQQLLVSQGLWPMPAKTPLQPVIHGRIELDGYSVEKVYFQSLPGFYVTGNLYRPLGPPAKRPGVLSPHGHWANGRFYDCGQEAVLKAITQGAERFEQGGRNPLQARCVQLARMGCVVFHWDMIGYADSQQLSLDLIHGFSKQRPEMNDPDAWGLFSPQAESRLQSAMGLQTWNAIRALDFLTSLPDVDVDRIAVTGASGGGTQTFMLAALDPRVQVAFPAVMVSTAMQGGCTCENACCLRVGTGNIEIAALFAPKPLGLTGADDWTKEMETKGLPELEQLYAMYGVPHHVMLKPLLHFDHNYNYVSRAAMYSWFNRHLGLGCQEPVIEPDYRRLTTEEMTVWNDDHPRPPGGPELERQVLRWWTEDAAGQLAAVAPRPGQPLEPYRSLVSGGVTAILGGPLPEQAAMQFRETAQHDRGDYRQTHGLLTRPLTDHELVGYPTSIDRDQAHEQLPLVLLSPLSATKRVCVIVTPDGKSGLFDPEGEPTAAVRRLLREGTRVVGVDLLYQGEFLNDRQTLEKTRSVPNPREAAAYTFGYNTTLFASRVRDLLWVIQWLRSGEDAAPSVDLIAMAGAGHWGAAARGLAGSAVRRMAVDTLGFRFAQVRAIHDPDFLPGGAKYDDLPGMLALAAPANVWISGETASTLPQAVSAYQALNAEDALNLYSGAADSALDAAIDWLLQP